MKYQHLTLHQEYEIKAYLKCNKSQKFIAQQMGVSESTISRELKRNELKRVGYNPQNAQEQVNIRKERFAVNRKFISKIAVFVEEKIRREQWSPQQIVGSQNVVLQSGTSTLQRINSSTDVVLFPDENIKSLADGSFKDIVAQFQTDNILRGNENWSFKVVINNDDTPDSRVVESYFGLSSANSKDSILSTLDFELYCGKNQWRSYLYTQGFGKMIREVNSTVVFTKYQNNLSIIVLGLSGTNVFISTHIINTDNDYRFVFGRNNGGTKRSSSFFITEAYKF